jgi:hypothetical protein
MCIKEDNLPPYFLSAYFEVNFFIERTFVHELNCKVDSLVRVSALFI